MKILLIGNAGTKNNLKDGQTTKMRLYHKKIMEEGNEVTLVDLESFFHHPFKVFKSIKVEIKKCDRIVLISGERACKLLIPLINRWNKKRKVPFVLPLVGSGVLHFSIDHLSKDKQLEFINEKKFDLGKKKRKIEKELKKISFILPETELMKDVYESFYGLNNCAVLNNFRDVNLTISVPESSNKLSIVFLSRVMRLKGIFELIDALNKIKKDGFDISLDIYGDLNLSENDMAIFYSKLNENIMYKGGLDNSEVIEKISHYDLFAFPTNAAYEGTPGVIAESLIAGTPVLSSNFPQAKYLLKDGYDSIIYQMFDVNDLEEKTLYCLNNKTKLAKMRANAIKSGEKYLYKNVRDKFLKYVCGVE